MKVERFIWVTFDGCEEVENKKTYNKIMIWCEKVHLNENSYIPSSYIVAPTTNLYSLHSDQIELISECYS